MIANLKMGIVAALSMAVAVPMFANAYAPKPKVAEPVVMRPIPIAEYKALVKVQSCVRKAYDADPAKETSGTLGPLVDSVSTGTYSAKEAQAISNREAFDFNVAEVKRITATIYPACNIQ